MIERAAIAVRALRTILLDRLPRLFLFASVSVAGGVLVLLVKTGLFAAAPDLFLLANILFAAGALATKLALLLRKANLRGKDSTHQRRAEVQAYRRAGIALVGLSVLYLLTLAPVFFGVEAFRTRELWAGIAIAAVAFFELSLTVVATVAGRHDAAPIASAIRRTNLAAAILLIAQAQSLLVSAIHPGTGMINAICAVGFALPAGLVGAGMVGRSSARATCRMIGA